MRTRTAPILAPRSAPGAWLFVAAAAACAIAALLSLFGTFALDDGTWPSYARELLAGKRIYSDLALKQQPLFPLVSVAGVLLGPPGILGDRLVFVPLALAYVFVIFRLAADCSRRPAEAALLGLALFWTAIHFEGFRFDDYHLPTQLLVLALFLASYRFLDARLSPTAFALILGGGAALTFLTRINEGMAVSVAGAVVLLARLGLSRSLARACLIGLLSALAVIAAVLLTIRETPPTWLWSTIVDAAGAKGGGSHIAAYPLLLYRMGLRVLLMETRVLFPCALLAGAGVLAWRTGRPRLAIGAVVVAVAWGVVWLTWRFEADSLFDLTPPALLVATLALLALVGCVLDPRRRGPPPPALTLAIFPWVLFITGSLSSGGNIYGFFLPIALLLALAGLACRPAPAGGATCGSPAGLATLARAALTTLLLLICVQAIAFKLRQPYSWQSYRSPAVGARMSFRDDPGRGPLLTSPEVRDVLDPVCRLVPPDAAIYSLPFPVANYYCGRPLWNGVVQTFYDMASPSQVKAVERALATRPPPFILYQQQPAILALHEEVYNRGRPIEHRRLEELIAGKVRAGDWTVVFETAHYPPSHWFLIRTVRPVR